MAECNERKSNQPHPLQQEDSSLRAKLRATGRVPYLWPVEELADGEHNVIVRLLEEANKRKVGLAELIEGDSGVILTALEAERSRVRRARAKIASEMSEEMSKCLPAPDCLRPEDGAEVIEALARKVHLTDTERKYLRLRLSGVEMNDELSALLGVERDELYRLKNKVKIKLVRLPTILKDLLETKCSHAKAILHADGVWRRTSTRTY